MATPMTADELVAAFRRWGVPVEEHPGWRTHNHDDAQPWGPVHGILLHHTGDDAPDDADVRVLFAGRSDLAGPLCTWAMQDDGTAVMIANGTAYHAGTGAANVMDALVHDRPVPQPGPDASAGNRNLYGQETCYSGSHRMTEAAYRSTVRAFAAICEHHGWSANSCIGHKEWTRRKVDPGSLDMDAFRADVQAALDAGPDQGDDMSDADVAKILAGVEDLIAKQVIWAKPQEGDPALRSVSLMGIGIVAARRAYNAETLTRAALSKLDNLTAAVAALAGEPDVDPQAVATALAPLLAASIQQWSDPQIEQLAAAITDEQARRLAAR